MAVNGIEAVAMCAATEYAAVFMDCQMPELDGYEATKRIRASGASHAVPIIAMTAHSMSGGRERCLAAGMDDYLTKPVRPEALDAVLHRWVLGAARDEALNPGAPGVVAGVTLDDVVVAGLRDGFDAPSRERLVVLFEESTRATLEALGVALRDRDAPEVRRLAHLLKGSGASLGAQAFSEACRQLEQRAVEPQHLGDVGPEDLEPLLALVQRSQTELRLQLLSA